MLNNVNIYFVFLPSQIVKLMKPIVAASSHVLGNKDVDNGECHSWSQAELNDSGVLKLFGRLKL